MPRRYVNYFQYALNTQIAESEKLNVNEFKAKTLEEELLKRGYHVLISGTSRNGVPDQIVVGVPNRKMRNEFPDIAKDLDLPYEQKGRFTARYKTKRRVSHRSNSSFF